MSLANKHRPPIFSDVIGQEHSTKIFQAHVSKGTNHSNYLLYGPRGTGKTTCARILAKGLNCETPVKGDPCNQCPSCSLINTGTTLDIIEIDAASHTGVDNIRNEIIDKAGYAPAQLRMKIYIIDEVHMLSKGAFNALLKIMEEPGDKLRFILATTEIHKVPDTIISRCQVFNFRRIPLKKITEHLSHIAKKEGLQTEPKALELIAHMSEGCMRDAIKYVDQVSILGDISEKNVTTFLGIAKEETVHDFIQSIIQAKKDGSAKELLETLTILQEQGIDLQQFTKQILAFLDKNLQANIEDYTPIAEVFYHIAGDSKRYPHPLLLYKTKLIQYVQDTMQSIHTAGHPTSSKPQTNNVLKPEKKSAVQSPKPQKPENKAEASTTEQKTIAPVDTKNLQKLTESFIAAIDKPSLQSMLHDQCNIQGIKGNIATLVIINSMAKLQVKKKDTQQYLEETLSKVIGTPHVLDFVFKSKEEFMQEQLFSDIL